MLSFRTNNFLRARQQASQVLSKFNTITTKETKGRARESSSSLMETELFSNLFNGHAVNISIVILATGKNMRILGSLQTHLNIS